MFRPRGNQERQRIYRIPKYCRRAMLDTIKKKFKEKETKFCVAASTSRRRRKEGRHVEQLRYV